MILEGVVIDKSYIIQTYRLVNDRIDRKHYPHTNMSIDALPLSIYVIPQKEIRTDRKCSFTIFCKILLKKLYAILNSPVFFFF